MLFALFQAVAAPCDPSALSAALQQAEQAFEARDRASVVEARKSAARHLTCADSQSAAGWYRTEALLALLDDDAKAAQSAFRASVAAHPLLPLPSRLAKNPSVVAPFHAAQEASITWKSGGVRRVNGVLTPLRPDTDALGRRSGTWIRPVGISVLAVSGGLYAAAWTSRKKFDRTAGLPAVQRLPSYRATNRLTGASIGAAVVGSGLLGFTILR